MLPGALCRPIFICYIFILHFFIFQVFRAQSFLPCLQETQLFSRFKSTIFMMTDFFQLYWGCVCDNWKPNFLPHLIFNWRTFSRQFTARWSRGWAKNQVWTNQNSRNRWCQIARGTICIIPYPSNAFETAEFWCMVNLIAILRLLQQRKKIIFFNT